MTVTFSHTGTCDVAAGNVCTKVQGSVGPVLVLLVVETVVSLLALAAFKARTIGLLRQFGP